MSVVNIPPDYRIYNLGKINGSLHVYNTGRPAGGLTIYDLTIIGVNHWHDVQIAAGHTHTYQPLGNTVYIQNNGPDILQCLYAPLGRGLLPAEAGVIAVSQIEQQSAVRVGGKSATSSAALPEKARQFIATLDLEDPAESTVPLLKRQFRLKADEKAAYVDDGALMTFREGVSAQHKADVLNSCLLAQLAANKKHDREADPKAWYDYYRFVLENIAWVIRGWEFERFRGRRPIV